MRNLFSRLGKALLGILIALAIAVAWGVFMFAAMGGLCWVWGGCV